MFPAGQPPGEPFETLNPEAAEYCRLEKVEACRIALRKPAQAGWSVGTFAAKLIGLLAPIRRRWAVRRTPESEPLNSGQDRAAVIAGHVGGQNSARIGPHRCPRSDLDLT